MVAPASGRLAPPRWLSAADIVSAVSPARARDLIHDLLAAGFDPAADPPRLGPFVPAGQLLVMPSAIPDAVGVKIAAVAPDNPARGLPRIQAVYVLMDADTLTPTAFLDGTALTTLRTPAVSAVAADALADPDADSLVIFGAGPQAVAHADSLALIRPLRSVAFVARSGDTAAAAVDEFRATPGSAHADVRSWAASSLDAVQRAVRDAGIVVAATSAATPVLDGSWVADGACVIAVGSHEPDRRELDGQLLGRSLVVVEDVATARREAGDVIMAVAEGALAWDSVQGLRQVVRGEVSRDPLRPNVFKSVGMSWQDVVVAHAAATSPSPSPSPSVEITTTTR